MCYSRSYALTPRAENQRYATGLLPKSIKFSLFCRPPFPPIHVPPCDSTHPLRMTTDRPNQITTQSLGSHRGTINQRLVHTGQVCTVLRIQSSAKRVGPGRVALVVVAAAPPPAAAAASGCAAEAALQSRVAGIQRVVVCELADTRLEEDEEATFVRLCRGCDVGRYIFEYVEMTREAMVNVEPNGHTVATTLAGHKQIFILLTMHVPKVTRVYTLGAGGAAGDSWRCCCRKVSRGYARVNGARVVRAVELVPRHRISVSLLDLNCAKASPSSPRRWPCRSPCTAAQHKAHDTRWGRMTLYLVLRV